MKTFEALGISIIKCQNKQTCDSLKDLQYDMNKVLYPLTKRIASKKAINRLRNCLISKGKKITELSCPASAEAKKKEILNNVKSMCISLGEQLKIEEDISQDEANKVFRYQIAQYIKQKAQDLSNEEILKLLEQNKEISEDYPNPTVKFVEMQNELLERLKERYRIT